MAKSIKVLCEFCETKLTLGASFCEKCGRPTRWATHEERTTWEVWQWRRSERARARHPASAPQRRRFSAAVADESPARDRSESSSAAVAVAVAPAPERLLVAVPAPLTATTTVPSPEAVEAPSLDRAASDHPTVLALRVLNQRVAELDGELRKLRETERPRRRLFGR